MGIQRWDSLSPELALAIQSTTFLDVALAQQKTLEHVFRNRSVASEIVLASEFLKRGVGTVSMEQAKAFVRDDPRFVQSLLVVNCINQSNNVSFAAGVPLPWSIRRVPHSDSNLPQKLRWLRSACGRW